MIVPVCVAMTIVEVVLLVTPVVFCLLVIFALFAYVFAVVVRTVMLACPVVPGLADPIVKDTVWPAAEPPAAPFNVLET